MKTTQEGESICKALNNAFGGSYDFSKPIYSSALEKIILYYVKDSSTRETCRMINSIEQRIRNIAAHEIVSVNRNWIIKQSKYSPDKIMEYIRSFFEKACPKVTKKMWNSYDDMNQKIKAALLKV